METLKKRLEEQKERHQGGNKWIGTGGTSPFGNGGYNPEGVRIGGESKHGARSRSGTSASSRTSTTPRNSAPATSRSRCAACAASRAKARPTNSTSTRRSTAPRGRAGSTSGCGPSGTMRSSCCCSSTSAARWTRASSCARNCSRAATTEFKNLEFFYFHNCLVRRRVEGQSPPLRRAHADVGRAPQIRPRLQADLRRRRVDEPVRDHPSRRLGRAFQRGSRARSGCSG